jgi:4-hydroxy-2-oxoglutarate aldolase
MSLNLRGVFGPVVTTFDSASGDVAVAEFVANIRAHLAAGLHGVVVGGSTGEAVLLDEAELDQLAHAARGVVPADRALIVGVGAESTRLTVARARRAAAAGADAVLVVSPRYYASAMTAGPLLAHFRRVADASPVPVLLYNIPKYVGFSLGPAVVTDLAAHPNIVGLKDSSGNRDLVSVYVNAQREDFSVLNGSGSLVHGALAAGARGAVLAVSLFAPELALAVFQAMQRGDEAAAVAAQDRLTPLSATIVGTLGVPGVKAALAAIGLHGGPVRAPLHALEPAEVRQVRALLASEALAAAS